MRGTRQHLARFSRMAMLQGGMNFFDAKIRVRSDLAIRQGGRIVKGRDPENCIAIAREDTNHEARPENHLGYAPCRSTSESGTGLVGRHSFLGKRPRCVWPDCG